MKASDSQLSFFDFTFDNKEIPEFFEFQLSETVSEKKEALKKTSHLENPCPYKIPTVDEIIKFIDSAPYRINKSQFISDVLECGAIAISNTVDFTVKDEREERYLEIINKYEPKEREMLAETFGKIYALLASVVYDDGSFNDYLGEIFMRCNQGNKNTGQFFTPYHISHFMAEIAIFDDSEKLSNALENDGILTLCDPCSGGGGMMVAALDVLKNEYNVNYARNCFIECSDIDIRCVHMTYLQLALAGVPAIVKHQNSLSRELWSVWKTPAFIFQYMRFCKYENYN